MAVETLPPLYKFLREDGSAPSGTGRYTKGRWRSVSGVLVPCQHGLHATTADNLVPFINAELWRVESGGEYVWHEDASLGRKFVGRRLRTVERVEAWNERTARLFAADCAERVLPMFDAQSPNDDRPRRAIETARRFADGEATRGELDAARDAAWAASRAAARDAAWDAARDAARAAARDAAWAAARDAARAAERGWQNRRLAEMLGLAGDLTDGR